MIISKSKKFIFIHIWKTAGTSITDRLIKHGAISHRLADEFFITKKIIGGTNRFFSLENYGNKWFIGAHKHASAKSVLSYVGDDCWEDYYSFAFVRNPYDWLVSWYFYVKQSDGRHVECDLVNKLSFKEFVMCKVNGNCPSQWDFVSVDDELIINFVGRLEMLQEDFNKVCDEVSIPREALGVTNVTKREPFLSYYDNDLMKVVEEYFRKDFEEFGYKKLSVDI